MGLLLRMRCVAPIALSMCALVSTAASAASLYSPLVDTGLTVATPRPDVDLVMVRERWYGSPGVDLTPYGIGTGADDFVQSIYFRLFTQSSGSQEDAVLGTVTFPPGVRILGFITASSDLGSSSPSPVYTGSDALFAVAANPADYSSAPRGFEGPGTGTGSSEFICQSSERSFVFGLDVTNGMDDFRVIIDYGGGFEPDLTFELDLYGETLGSASGAAGVRIGDPSDGAVPGSGDEGEVTHIRGIPLTTDDQPVAGVMPPAPGRGLIYLARETGAGARIDGIEASGPTVIPSMIQAAPSELLHPRALVFAADGMIYGLDDPTGLARIDPATGSVTRISYPPQVGISVRMASVRGDSRLFILRQTSYPDPEDAFVDTYDTATGLFTPSFAVFPTGLLPHPVDLIAGTDGILYALGIGDAFHSVNPVTGAVTGFAQPVPNLPGDYVKGTADPYSGLIYLLRLTTAGAFLDTIDTVTRQFSGSVVALPPSVIPDPAAAIMDNEGVLWVFGKNGGAIAFDPARPGTPPFYQTRCLDFAGFSTHAAIPRLPAEVSPPLSARPLDVAVSPWAGLLRLSWEDAGPGAAYNVYAGALGDYYSHAPSACHIPGSSLGTGWIFTDVPVPAGSVYFLVTASRGDGEGSAGPRPVSASGPACGPLP